MLHEIIQALFPFEPVNQTSKAPNARRSRQERHLAMNGETQAFLGVVSEAYCELSRVVRNFWLSMYLVLVLAKVKKGVLVILIDSIPFLEPEHTWPRSSTSCCSSPSC